MTEAAGDQTRQRPPGRYAFTGVSHVFGVAAGDLLVRVAEPQNLLDLAGGLQGDGAGGLQGDGDRASRRDWFQFILLRARISEPARPRGYLAEGQPI